MKRIKYNRLLSVIMIVTVAMTFTLMTTVGASAAAKKKTVYQVVSYSYESKAWDDLSYSGSTKYTYDKRGLLKQEVSKSEGSATGDDTTKFVYSRNKKGAITGMKGYDNNKLSSTDVYTLNKKGNPTKIKGYTVKDGKKTLSDTTTIKYYKNGNKSTQKIVGHGEFKSESTFKYRKDGTLSKSVFKNGSITTTTTYNKKGDAIKVVNKSKNSEEVATYKHTYNKKKHTQKTVETIKSDSSKMVNTTTVKETLDKHGNVTKRVETVVTKYDGKTQKRETTTKYKYKAFKVAKKYLPYI